MAKIDIKYHDLVKEIQSKGYSYEDPNRKGIMRKQISSYTIEHDFKDGFPAITTKQLAWKSVVGELLWILRGDTNIKYLVDNKIPIWNKDAYNYAISNCNYNKPIESFINDVIKGNKLHGHTFKLGDISRGYGAQLRNWTKHSMKSANDGRFGMKIINEPIDQLSDIIHTLKNNPMATKKTVTFWNPAEKEQCALTPCHWSFEVLVEPLYLGERVDLCNEEVYYNGDSTTAKHELFLDNKGVPKYQLSIKWHQHSVDVFHGLPFNIASYGLLTQILAKLTNMVPKGIIGDFSNVHIYEPHFDAINEQMSRDVNTYGECSLNDFGGMKLDMHGDIDQWLSSKEISDFTLNGYKSHPRIVAEMLPYSN